MASNQNSTGQEANIKTENADNSSVGNVSQPEETDITMGGIAGGGTTVGTGTEANSGQQQQNQGQPVTDQDPNPNPNQSQSQGQGQNQNQNQDPNPNPDPNPDPNPNPNPDPNPNQNQGQPGTDQNPVPAGPKRPRTGSHGSNDKQPLFKPFMFQPQPPSDNTTLYLREMRKGLTGSSYGSNPTNMKTLGWFKNYRNPWYLNAFQGRKAGTHIYRLQQRKDDDFLISNNPQSILQIIDGDLVTKLYHENFGQIDDVLGIAAEGAESHSKDFIDSLDPMKPDRFVNNRTVLIHIKFKDGTVAWVKRTWWRSVYPKPTDLRLKKIKFYYNGLDRYGKRKENPNGHADRELWKWAFGLEQRYLEEMYPGQTLIDQGEREPSPVENQLGRFRQATVESLQSHEDDSIDYTAPVAGSSGDRYSSEPVQRRQSPFATASQRRSEQPGSNSQREGSQERPFPPERRRTTPSARNSVYKTVTLQEPPMYPTPSPEPPFEHDSDRGQSESEISRMLRDVLAGNLKMQEDLTVLGRKMAELQRNQRELGIRVQGLEEGDDYV
ncbi:hypothetical protein FALBO_5981 [Fusarium albosuccineum]|uniref:Uncharacterized protein n=1 Tax=Fusarium albosuccineum TaxID=1237068 RepID=A0A8H4LCK2_9HYPO|nr:hypothetical protein FALBO_5981 [Fusarium albosuccineum]